MKSDARTHECMPRPASGTSAEASGERYLLVTTDCAAVLERLSHEESSPRQDFVELAKRLNARILSFSDLGAAPLSVRVLRRCFGPAVALAWYGFRQKGSFYFTTAENSGMALAFLLKFRSRVPHVMIGHRISAGKKKLIFKCLRLFKRIDAMICYSQSQVAFAREYLGVPEDRVRRIDFQVDEQFYTPGGQASGGVVSVGRELRDYPTLFEAVKGLDVPVTVVASSPWSRRQDQTRNREIPANVTLRRGLTSEELRDLYRGASLVAVPLQDVDSPAGVTTILEAQAVGRPVLVSASPGILDSIEPQQTAFTVPCGDASALRKKLEYLLGHPAETAQVADAGHRSAVAGKTLDQFLARIAEICRKAETGE
jgi:glycosyltransferase involved in cell wall biosynthesis